MAATLAFLVGSRTRGTGPSVGDLRFLVLLLLTSLYSAFLWLGSIIESLPNATELWCWAELSDSLSEDAAMDTSASELPSKIMISSCSSSSVGWALWLGCTPWCIL
jgi:hypothetical protein